VEKCNSESRLWVTLIPATAQDFFTEDTPSAVLVRQLLGVIAQFEKTSLGGEGLQEGGDQEVRGRKTYAESRPTAVAFAKELHAQGVSLRDLR